MGTEVAKITSVQDAKRALTIMFNCFNFAGNETERKIKISAYWDVLCRLPPNTVASACREGARGDLGERGFLPSADLVYKRAVAHLPRHVEKLPPPDRVIPPDELARVVAGFKALTAEMHANREAERAADAPPRPGAEIDHSKPIRVSAPLQKILTDMAARNKALDAELTEQEAEFKLADADRKAKALPKVSA